MNETTYSAFSMGVHQRTSGKRVPMEVSIEVTRRCPLECLHCYNNLPMADHAARMRELSLEEYRRLLDEIADAGCFWILFTGGEIFARADFLDIYSYAKSKGFLITLFTNGTMITERIADFLAEYRPFAIEITLYGATRQTYDALTQIRWFLRPLHPRCSPADRTQAAAQVENRPHDGQSPRSVRNAAHGPGRFRR